MSMRCCTIQQYRERYAENLKRDLPHIPLLHRKEAFQDCVRIGRQLMDIHLHYEQAKEYPLKWIENKDVPIFLASGEDAPATRSDSSDRQ